MKTIFNGVLAPIFTQEMDETSQFSKTRKDPIPKWIIWYGVIVMIGAPLVNAIMTFMGPDLGVVTLADGSDIETGLFKYAVRNVAAAVITGYALYKRSAAMLLIVFFMRFMTEAGDLLDSLLFGNMDVVGIASFVAFMIFLAFVPYTIAIRKLWPIVRFGRRGSSLNTGMCR